METVLIITGIMALVCLAALSIYLIVVLVRLRSVLTNLEKDLNHFTERAIPVLENIETITAKFKGIAEGIEGEFDSIKGSMNSIKEMVENVANFERKVQERIEMPILEAVASAAAIFKGVRAFLDRIRS